jgi:hypothetical protein
MGDLSCHLQNLAYCDIEAKLMVVSDRQKAYMKAACLA